VRAAAHSKRPGGRRPGRRAGVGWAAAAGAFVTMGYLAILRRGVASRAITSVTMFMTT
jgi:hypothetical protein